MHYLIDGHNLIAKMPDISLDDPNDEMLLVLRLRSWVAAGRKRRVSVIFDGGLPGGRSRFHSSNALNVIFAPEDQSADALLIRRVRRANNPSEYTLVSSDRQVIGAAQARRMKHIPAEAFARRLAEMAQKDQSPPEVEPDDEATDPAVSREEVAEWLALFEAAPKVRREAPRPPAGQAKKQKEKSPEASPGKQRSRPKTASDPAALKSGAGTLSGDEVDEWLKLFNQDDEG